MWRLIFAIAALGFLIALGFTDLNNGQRWLLAGLVWSSVIANWDRS